MFTHIRQLGRDSLVYGGLDVANRFVGILLVPIYTRVLAPADYGSLDLVTTLVTVMYVVFYLGQDSALTYYYNQAEVGVERRRTVTTAAVLWASAVSLGTMVVLALSVPLAEMMLPGVGGATHLLWLAAIALPFQAILYAQIYILRVTFAFRRYAILSLGLLLVTVGLNIYLVAVLRLGVEGVLLANLWSRIAFAGVAFLLTRREYGWPWSRSLMRPMLRYGAPLVLSNLAFWVVLYMERFALLHFATLADVGLYGIATRVATIATLASNAVDMAWMPFAMSVQRDEQAPQIYARTLTYYLLLTGLVGTVIALFARETLVVLTQPQYVPAYILVGPIVAALLARGVFNMVAVGAFVTERTGVMGWLAVATTLLDGVLLVGLVPPLGSLGAALATLLTRLTGIVLLYRITRQHYHVPYELGRIARMLALFVLCVLAGLLVSQVDSWLSLAVKGFVLIPGLIIGLLLAGVVSRSELRTLQNRVRRRFALRLAKVTG